VEPVEDHLLHGFLDLLHLAEDHTALEVEAALVQRRVLQDVGKNVDALAEIVLETLRVVDSLFP